MATDQPAPKFQILDAESGRPVDVAAAFNDPANAPKLHFFVDHVSSGVLDSGKEAEAAGVASKITDPAPLEAVEGVLDALMEDERSYPFLEPVDHVALGLNDYLSVVKRPMDLGTIKRRLAEDRFYDLPSSTRTLRYINGQRVFNDVMLVFDNCMKYNQDGSQIFQFAAQLKASFRTKWSREVAKVDMVSGAGMNTRVLSRRQARSRKPTCIGSVVDYVIVHSWDDTSQLWLVINSDKNSGLSPSEPTLVQSIDLASTKCVIPLHDEGIVLYRVASVSEGRNQTLECAEPEEQCQRELTLFLARFHALVRLLYELRAQALKPIQQRITVLELIAKVTFHCIESERFQRGVSYTDFYTDNADFFCHELDKVAPGMKSTLNFAKTLKSLSPRVLNVLLLSLPNAKGYRITDSRRSLPNEPTEEPQRSARESLKLPPPRPLQLYMNQSASKLTQHKQQQIVGRTIKVKANGVDQTALVLRYRPRTRKHLLKFLASGKVVWTDLDELGFWDHADNSDAAMEDASEGLYVALPRRSDLRNFEVPPKLMSGIVSVFLFFKTFRDKLDIDMPLFTFEELCTAVLTKSVSEYEEIDLQDAPRTSRLLMRIHIALLELYVRTSTLEQAQIAVMDKSQSLKAVQARRPGDDIIKDWAFNQVVHTEEALSLFYDVEEPWQHEENGTRASLVSNSVNFSYAKDPAWQATPKVFLTSLFQFYSHKLKWDPGYAPRVGGASVDLYALYSLVQSCGGTKELKEEDWIIIVDLLHLSYEGEEELETTVKSLQEVHTRYLADYQKHIGSRSSGVQLEPGIEFSVWPNIRRNGAAIGRIKLESARTQSVQQKTVAKTKDVLSAFDRLVSTQRKALKEAGREMDEAELVKLCQGLWSNMSNSEKDYYETLATKSDGQVKPNAAQPGEATTPRSANSGVQGFAEKNLCFNALNELTWQEILIETLKRIDPTFSSKQEKYIQTAAAPVQRRERRGRPRRENKVEGSEDMFDVGEYDLAEEEEKETELWSSILGEGKLVEVEKGQEANSGKSANSVKNMFDHAKRLVDALISHPLYAHYANPTVRLKNYANVVKTPMDLEIVMKRLLGGYYSTSATTLSLEAFERDIDLIWTNACLFFKNTSTPYEDAVHLRGIFNERVEPLRKLHEQTEKEQVARDLEEFKRVVMGLDEKDARNEYKKIAEKWQVEEAPVKTSYFYGDPASANLKKKFARIAMKQLFSDLRSEPFREPVDAVALGLTDYHDVIKNPMDLGTIRKNLKHGLYDAPGAADLVTPRFVQDVRLVFSNCRLYNERGSEISEAATLLENAFLHLLEQHSRETAAEDRAKEQAKKEAEKSRLEAAKKEAETKQNALSTPRKGVPESPGGAQTPRSTPAQTAPPVQALTPGPTPSPSSVAMPSSAQAITAPGGSVNATEMSFVDSCVQLLDIMMSAPGVQFIGTSINGTPIPLHDALNVLKLKLLNGDYNLHDNEVGTGFAFELRQLMLQTSGMTIPGSVPWNTLEAIRVLFEKEYHKRLGYVATSKWTFVGEEFIWLDNSNAGQPVPRRGIVKEYYGPPKYNLTQMSRPADFDHLCCHVEGYNMLLSLNFWTQGTVKRLGPGGLGNFANFYGKNWAFIKDEDAVRTLMQGLQQPPSQPTAMSQQAVPQPTMPGAAPSPATNATQLPSASKPVSQVSPAVPPTKPEENNTAMSVESKPKPSPASKVGAVPSTDSRKVEADESAEEPEDVVSAQDIPVLKTVFWPEASVDMEDDAKCERIAELLCQHDYADIDPECKLYILEKLCVAISELYKSKLAIAKDMGLRAPRMIPDAPREELPKSPIKKRKPAPVPLPKTPPPSSSKRQRRTPVQTPSPPPAQSTRSGRKSTQPQRFNFHQMGDTDEAKPKPKVVYRVGDAIELYSKEKSEWVPGVMVRASRGPAYIVKIDGRRVSVPKSDTEGRLRKEQGIVPDLPLDYGDFVVLALGRIITSDSRIAGGKLYHSHRYIFPVGFKSKRLYPSVNDPKQKVWYTSEISQGSSGPVFTVTHQGGSPTFTGTATSRVWSQVLDELNEARVKAGLPKGGKLISGPTQYGFTNEKLQLIIEKLGGASRCKKYIMVKDRETTRRSDRSPARDGSDVDDSDSDEDTDGDDQFEADQGPAETIVTNSGDSFLPAKFIADTNRRKLEEDIIHLERGVSTTLSKRAMSRYLRKSNKQADIPLPTSASDGSSSNMKQEESLPSDEMEVDENDADVVDKLSVTHEHALRSLQEIRSNPEFSALCSPVDSSQNGLETYLNVIKEPADFGTIEEELRQGMYVKDGFVEKELLKRLELVISNCCVFNADGSALHQMAIRCERQLNTLLGLQGSRFAINGGEAAKRKLKLTKLLMDLLDKLMDDPRAPSVCRRGEFGFDEVLAGLESGRYIYAPSKSGSQTFNVRNLQALQALTGFALDMRSIFLNCLKAARGEESSRFQDATELEAVFEEEYAKILGEVAWPQHRMYWLGEKVYLYDDEIEDVIVAVVVSIKEVRGDLSFVLADEQDRFEIDLHTKDTLVGESTDEDTMIYGKDWIFVNDTEQLVAFMQLRSLKSVDDRTLDSWREDLLLSSHGRRTRKQRPNQRRSRAAVEQKTIPIAEATPMPLTSRPTEREIENRIETFMQQERVKQLCDIHADEDFNTVVKPEKKVPKPKPVVDKSGKEPNYSIETTLEIKINRRNVVNHLPFKFVLDKDSNRARVAARKLEASADSLFGKVQVGDLLLEVNGRDAKFSRSGSIDQTLNMMLQSGGDSRALVVTFRGRRDLHIARLCTLNRVPIDPNGLYEAVEAYGGFESIVENQWWQKVRVHMGLSFATSSGHQLRKAYEIYFGDLTDSHSKTVGGKVNGIKQSSVEETEANSSGDGGEEEAGSIESLKVRPLKDAVVVPRVLHESGPTRLEPLGRDRHFNLYWHMNISLMPQEMLARALLFVELTPEGLAELKRCNPHTDVTERSWLKFSSRAEIDTLLARLDKSIGVEAKLWENLTERYTAIVSAMRVSGTEFCELPAFVPGSEAHSFMEITTRPADSQRVQLASSPVVFGGATFVCSITDASSTGAISPAALIREERNMLQIGDVIVRVGQRPCLAETTENTAKLLQQEMSDEKFSVLIYRPKSEAFFQAQALTKATVGVNAPSVMLNPMRICPAIDQAFFHLVSTLENKLWDLGSADPRILKVLKEWRWLHGWGDWQWPRWRDQWQELIKDLAQGSKSPPSGCTLTTFELGTAALRTICRNFVSTMPPVHPDCYREGRYRLDYTYESLISESSQTEDPLGKGLKLSQVLTGLPVEGDWLRELERSQTYSNLSLLATWLYTESAARFSSAIYVANRSETRLLDFQRLKPSIQAKLRRERLDDVNAWTVLHGYQETFRQLLKAEVKLEKTVSAVVNSLVARVAGEEVPEEDDAADETSSVASEKSEPPERKRKRIPTPFEVFVAETKEELTKRGEQYDYRQVTSECGVKWRAMTSEEKKQYERTESDEPEQEKKQEPVKETEEEKEKEVQLTDKELDEIRQMAEEDTRFFPKKRGPGRPRKSPFATPLPRKTPTDEDIQRRKRRRLALLKRFDVTPPKSNRRQSSVAAWKKFNGVEEIRNRYKAEIILKTGERQLIGRYDSAVEAALAYDVAARHHYPLKKAELLCNFPYKNTMQVLQGWLPDTPLFAKPISAPRPKPRPMPRSASLSSGPVRFSRDKASMPADMTCPICYKKFKSSGGLVYHMQIKVCEKRIERSDASLQALRQKNLERQMLQ